MVGRHPFRQLRDRLPAALRAKAAAMAADLERDLSLAESQVRLPTEGHPAAEPCANGTPLNTDQP